MSKFKLNLERLGVEMEVLDLEYIRGLKGGYGGYGGYDGNGTGGGEGGYPLPDYEIYDTYSPTIYGTPGGGPPPVWWFPPTGPGGYNPPSIPGGYSPSGYTPQQPMSNYEKAALAISAGFAYDEFYAAIDYTRINETMSANELVKQILDTPSSMTQGYRSSVAALADAAISVGSLFVKSNLAGVGISLGWMVIKGQFE